MSGFLSKITDAISRAAPSHGTVTVAGRGYAHFADPSMSGVVRFAQKAGFPFPLLTPQMSSRLLAPAAPGTRTIQFAGSRLVPWLQAGVVLAVDRLEDVAIESVSYDAELVATVTFVTALRVPHPVDAPVEIKRFPISFSEENVAGAAGPGEAPVPVSSPFLLVPGDTLVVDKKRFTLLTVDESEAGVYLIRVDSLSGLPITGLATTAFSEARPAYRSQLLSFPQAHQNAFVQGPVALDWVSGPMVAGYKPDPESSVYFEEYTADNRPIGLPRLVRKNDVTARVPIGADQFLFWDVVEGSTNWNGSQVQFIASEAGRAHVWSPCAPGIDAAAPVAISTVVPLFAPYRVLLQSRSVPGSVDVRDEDGAVIPAADYVVNEETGNLDFVLARAGTRVTVVYRPLLEWTFTARCAEAVEVCVRLGNEPLQTFALAAGVPATCRVQAISGDNVEDIHITARRASDAAGRFTVSMSAWTPRGPRAYAFRYSLSTGATVDYDWSSSALLLKPLWPNLSILAARLDGASILERNLDNGRLLLG